MNIRTHKLTHILFTLMLICGITNMVSAQGVAVNTIGAAADSSAILDIQSTTKGFLMPRMTTTERMSIDSPASGLLVYDTEVEAFWCFVDTSWVKVLSDYLSVLQDADGDTQIQVEESPDEDMIRFDLAGSERWVMIGTRLEPRSSGGSVFIGEDAGLSDNTTNNRNVAIGTGALKSNVYRAGLVAIGDSALFHNGLGLGPDFPQFAAGNTAVGNKSLRANTSGSGNTATGYKSMESSISGDGNTATGYKALVSNITGSLNTAYGFKSLYSNTDSWNTAIGFESMYSNTYGYRNTALGYQSLYANISGRDKTAIGSGSLWSNVSGINNTAVGSSSLGSNISGDENTATGKSALVSNETGNENVAVGYQALRDNTTGHSNTAIGKWSMLANISGRDNTAVGEGSLRLNTTGTGNIAIGHTALAHNTTGGTNIAIGWNTMLWSTTGNHNVVIGADAMIFGSTASDNTVIGYHAMLHNNSGNNNTAVGAYALWDNNTGVSNSALGYKALYRNRGGFSNTAMGWESTYNNIDGKDNTAMGFKSLHSNTSGDRHTAIGFDALNKTTTGNDNTAVGRQALFSSITGSARTALGNSANSTGSSFTNNTGLGFNADCTASSQVRIGNSGVSSIGGYANWSNVSDIRFKENVTEDVQGLAFIQSLRPVTYNLNLHSIERFFEEHYGEVDESDWPTKYDKENIRYTGFIAQEVEQAALDLGYDFSGVDKPKNEDDFYGLRYAEFVVPLVKGMQEQQILIKAQQVENADLRSELESIKAALQAAGILVN